MGTKALNSAYSLKNIMESKGVNRQSEYLFFITKAYKIYF